MRPVHPGSIRGATRYAAITNPDAERIDNPDEWVREGVHKTFKGGMKLLGSQTRMPGRYVAPSMITNEKSI